MLSEVYTNFLTGPKITVKFIGMDAWDRAVFGLVDALTPVQTQHYAAITSPADLGHLLRSIDATRESPPYAMRCASCHMPS